MGGWYEAAVEKLKLLYNLLKKQILSSEYIQIDESVIPVIDNEKHKTRKGYEWCLRDGITGDARVRRTHQKLHGITLPITSKFWDKYFPPNGWNCRCTVVQVRKDKYPLSDETQAMNLGSQATAGKHQEMFMYNPGKKMTTFPAYNAYTRKACINCKEGGSVKLAKVPDNELCQACRILWEIRRQEQRNNYSKIVSDLKEKLIGKYSFTDEHFNGRTGVFVKNSITENLGYGNLFYAKADILNNIE